MGLSNTQDDVKGREDGWGAQLDETAAAIPDDTHHACSAQPAPALQPPLKQNIPKPRHQTN